MGSKTRLHVDMVRRIQVIAKLPKTIFRLLHFGHGVTSGRQVTRLEWGGKVEGSVPASLRIESHTRLLCSLQDLLRLLNIAPLSPNPRPHWGG